MEGRSEGRSEGGRDGVEIRKMTNEKKAVRQPQHSESDVSESVSDDEELSSKNPSNSAYSFRVCDYLF